MMTSSNSFIFWPIKDGVLSSKELDVDYFGKTFILLAILISPLGYGIKLHENGGISGSVVF